VHGSRYMIQGCRHMAGSMRGFEFGLGAEIPGLGGDQDLRVDDHDKVAALDAVPLEAVGEDAAAIP
jgi:hypothetical protein